ncbi:putative methyltransferase-domain-containing protein [Haematococcus lacustris]
MPMACPAAPCQSYTLWLALKLWPASNAGLASGPGLATGVVGLALALAGARVTLTDLPHILPLTQLNADTNCPPPCSVSLLPHSWGQDTQQLLLQAGALDIITGADLLYEPTLYPALLDSLLGLMAPHSTAFLAYRKRCRAEEGFKDAAEARGLAVEDVPSALLDPEFRDGAYAVLRLARRDPPCPMDCEPG